MAFSEAARLAGKKTRDAKRKQRIALAKKLKLHIADLFPKNIAKTLAKHRIPAESIPASLRPVTKKAKAPKLNGSSKSKMVPAESPPAFLLKGDSRVQPPKEVIRMRLIELYEEMLGK